jgi:hypothetical protein
MVKNSLDLDPNKRWKVFLFNFFKNRVFGDGIARRI